MLIVQVCDFGTDGDAEYRMHSPSRQMGKLPGITSIDCHFSHRCLPELAASADVMVFQFVNDWDLLSLCQRRRAAGLLSVFEANDDFFDLQPWSPIAKGWQDRTVQELFLQLLATADAVQTSSVELARRWTECQARQVAVFPNHLVNIEPLPDVALPQTGVRPLATRDESDATDHGEGVSAFPQKGVRPPATRDDSDVTHHWEGVRPLFEPADVPDRRLTVGWGGSPGHFADWYQLAPLLTRWLLEHPEVQLAVMTHELAQPFIQLPPDRYHFTRFGSLQEYMQFLRSLDIGLAPLVNTGYNRGRSDVKFLEYASQGVAGIYTDLEPYRSTVEHGTTGLLSRTPAEMIEHLELLRSDPDLRRRISQQAYDFVKSHRQLPDRIGERITWYQSLLNRPVAANASLPLSVIEAGAFREDHYWQLRPQEPEQAFLDSLRQPDKRAAANRLGEQLEREPNYLSALVRQGQLLNDLRDHQQALQVLEQARKLLPQSARTLSEIGRSWFCLNDFVRARAVLEEAIEADPKYLPAWQYFFRFLLMSQSNDGAGWARRAEQLFPDCYPLTLLSAQVYPLPESLVMLTQVIDRLATTIVKQERTTALGIVRQSLATAIKAASHRPELLSLLRRAFELFPESAWIANELSSALSRAGQHDEAYIYHSQAWQIRQQAAVYREEFPSQDAIPWTWMFADHLCDHG